MRRERTPKAPRDQGSKERGSLKHVRRQDDRLRNGGKEWGGFAGSAGGSGAYAVAKKLRAAKRPFLRKKHKHHREVCRRPREKHRLETRTEKKKVRKGYLAGSTSLRRHRQTKNRGDTEESVHGSQREVRQGSHSTWKGKENVKSYSEEKRTKCESSAEPGNNKVGESHQSGWRKRGTTQMSSRWRRKI